MAIELRYLGIDAFRPPCENSLHNWSLDQSRKGLEKAVFAGMNLARLNFSRGTHDIHAQVVHDLRALSPTWEAPVAILQDLQGLKIGSVASNPARSCWKKVKRSSSPTKTFWGKPG